MARRVSTRRKIAAKKAKQKQRVADKHVGVRQTHVRTVNAPKAW